MAKAARAAQCFITITKYFGRLYFIKIELITMLHLPSIASAPNSPKLVKAASLSERARTASDGFIINFLPSYAAIISSSHLEMSVLR